MTKKEHNKLLEELQEKELAEFRAELPFDENYFPKLFDFINQKLDDNNCTNHYKFTEIFCTKNKLDFEKLAQWLQKEDHGYYCDCEVLNLEDAFQYLTVKKKISIKKKEFSTRKLLSLQTDFGFHLTSVENPWYLKEMTKNNATSYVFQLGNKEGHIVSFATNDTTTHFFDDAFLKNDYVATTDIVHHLDFIITRDVYQNYDWVMVKTIHWSPILVYFKPQDTSNWVLKLQTEIARYKGDLKEFYKILNHII